MEGSSRSLHVSHNRAGLYRQRHAEQKQSRNRRHFNDADLRHVALVRAPQSSGFRRGSSQSAPPARTRSATRQMPSSHMETASAPTGPATWSKPDSSANFAMNPDSGGNPARSTAHDRKLMPSTAMVAGTGMPTSPSSSISLSSGSPNASRVTASMSAPNARPRSTSSIRRKNALIANVELQGRTMPQR